MRELAALAAEDVDTLYAEVLAEMLQLHRDLLSAVIAQLVRDGFITSVVTDTEMTINVPCPAGGGVFRAERKRRVH